MTKPKGLTTDRAATPTPTGKRKHGSRPWTDAENAELRRLREAGTGFKAIAEKLGWSASAVAFQVKDLGIATPAKFGPPAARPVADTHEKTAAPPRLGAVPGVPTLPPLPSLQEPLYIMKGQRG